MEKEKMEKNYIYVGENLKVLNNASFIQNTGQVDTVYIDPPYNTKREFSYNDKKDRPTWLKFMSERLSATLPLMKESGVVFISIDDNEYPYLKVLCDEIFGEENCLGTLITKQSQRSNAKYINVVHEYILCYAKNKKETRPFKIKRIFLPEDEKMISAIVSKIKKVFRENGREEAKRTLDKLIRYYCHERNISWLRNYNCIDDEGNVFFAKDLSTPGKPRYVLIPEIGLKLESLKTRGWVNDKKFIELYRENRLSYKGSRPYEIHYLTDSEENVSSILNYYSRQGTEDLKRLGLHNLFDTPKPCKLLKFLIRISTPPNGTVLDYFAGSGSIAQAVYESNMEDNTSRHYILVQSEERMAENTKTYKACQAIHIEPIISEALIYRINRFLSKNGLKDDYVIIKII